MRKPKKEKAQITKLKKLGFVKDAKLVKIGRAHTLRITFRETVFSMNGHEKKDNKKVYYKKYFYLGEPIVDIGLYANVHPQIKTVKVYLSHPHISSYNSFCFGDASALVIKLLHSFNFEMLAVILWKWLHTYNNGHGYSGVNTITNRFFYNDVPIWRANGKRVKNTTRKTKRHEDCQKHIDKFKNKKLEGLI